MKELPGTPKLDLVDFFWQFEQVRMRRFYGDVRPFRFYAIRRSRALLALPWYSPQFK